MHNLWKIVVLHYVWVCVLCTYTFTFTLYRCVCVHLFFTNLRGFYVQIHTRAHTHSHFWIMLRPFYVPIFKRLLAAFHIHIACMPSTWHFRIIDRFIHRPHWKSLNFYFFGKHIHTQSTHTLLMFMFMFMFKLKFTWNASNEHDNLQTELINTKFK